MKKFNRLLFPLGILCCQANGASPVLINGNFDNFNIATAPYNTPYNATTAPNGFFEDFGGATGACATYYPTTTGIGWDTDQTGATDRIELWQSGFNNVSAQSGTGQFAELNAYVNAALYQDVTIADIGDVDYSFSHLNRNPGTDTMRVIITYLGLNDALGGGDDVELVNQTYGTTNTVLPGVWNDIAVNNAFATPVANGTYRFSFGAVSVAPDPQTGVGNIAQGNFIDNVKFGINVVPEPSAALLGSLGALALLRRRRR